MTKNKEGNVGNHEPQRRGSIVVSQPTNLARLNHSKDRLRSSLSSGERVGVRGNGSYHYTYPSLLRRLVLGGLALWVSGFPCRAADQPQWGRAWSRNMVSDERGLPDSFDPETGRNIKWSAELGTETHSTPVVAGGRVYIGTNNGHPRDPAQQGDRGILMCFDEPTGRFL